MSQVEVPALLTQPCVMTHWQDTMDHMRTVTQDFQSRKENKSYYFLPDFISSGHKYLDRVPLSHEGVTAGNGKQEHVAPQCHSQEAVP